MVDIALGALTEGTCATAMSYIRLGAWIRRTCAVGRSDIEFGGSTDVTCTVGMSGIQFGGSTHGTLEHNDFYEHSYPFRSQCFDALLLLWKLNSAYASYT